MRRGLGDSWAGRQADVPTASKEPRPSPGLAAGCLAKRGAPLF